MWARIRAETGHWRRRHWSFAKVGAHWDATEDYDDINAETYSYMRRFTDGLRLSDLPSGGHVLDLCARTGKGTLYFWQHGKIGSAICADVSEQMGRVCTARLTEAGFHDFEWVMIHDYNLPFEDQMFDAILCFETIEHVSQPSRLVAELGRVTKSGGQMILTTPNVLWEPVHALAAITGLHHSEGPHRFIPYRQLTKMTEDARFHIERAATTVLVPGGPQPLIRAGEWVEAHGGDWLMTLFGLRRILICRKM